MEVKFYDSNRKNKRLMAQFKAPDMDKPEYVHFGLRNGSTFIDHNDSKKKAAYIARHKVRENWNDPITPGALSRFILWNKPTIEESIEDYKKRFKLK